jgi:hypothetical protein
MARKMTVVLAALLMTLSAFAQDLSGAGFQKRFNLVKNDKGEVIAIRLKSISARFTLKPFIEQIKNDIIEEQRRWQSQGFADRETQVDQALYSMGLDPYGKEDLEEVRTIKNALMNVPAIDVQNSFADIERSGLFKEFESKIQDALLQLDLSVVANLSDARFFYRRNVAYTVVTWALDQAKKRFASVPVLNLASFVIVKVHDLLHEQRMFHHNMMLHYFETLPESAFGMTKDEVDRAVSSIYEYRIGAVNYNESNTASQTWARYGFNKFYQQVRAGNSRARDMSSPLFGDSRYTEYSRVDFAFGEFTNDGSRKIFHLLANQHMLSSKPALAYDYAKPGKVKRDRALLNLAQVALGFIPGVPSIIKSAADTFLNSMMKEQKLLEGALVAYFEMNGNQPMVEAVYKQNINPYLLR